MPSDADQETSMSVAVAALHNKPALARAAVSLGEAQVSGLLERIMDDESDDPKLDEFREPWSNFQLALQLDPENSAAGLEMEKLHGLLERLESMVAATPHQHSHPHHPHEHNHTEPLDVIVVGAGASGVGLGVMMVRDFGLDPQRILLVERGAAVGESFRRWPREMRFISPSFNQQGWTQSFDLNSVAYNTSPAFMLSVEHPTGEQYAQYLDALAKAAQLCVRTNTEVTAVRPDTLNGGFDVEVKPLGGVGSAPTKLRSRYVVWAAGEFQYPRGAVFQGSDHCLHNSSVTSWAELPGDDFIIIGGYESGMDAASNLASIGKRTTVVSSTAYWKVATEDPSTELAPYTADRVRAACTSPNPPRLLAPLRVFAVEQLGGDGDDGGFLVRARWGAPKEYSTEVRFLHRVPLEANAAAAATAGYEEGGEVSLRTPQPPLLCAGFEGSITAGVVKELFEWGRGKETDDDDEEEHGGNENTKQADGDGCAVGSPLLTEHDESTKTPGLFLVGPAVRHRKLSFCFVYKFRQRFGVVADAIARGLGRDTTKAVKACRKNHMFLDDFECCEASCATGC